MRKFATKAAALTLTLAVLLSALFAVPVSASGIEWWEHGYGDWGETLDRMLGGEFGQYSDDGGYISVADWLLGTFDYYTQSSVTPYSWDNSSGGGGGGGTRGGTANAYQSGQTVSVPIVGSTYNTSTNTYNYTLNVPTTNYNSTTNNYYNQYDITEIYYSTEYNTYNYVTNNNYNYYVTYSPTYVNITYLDSAKGEYVSNFHFYQLPDGRNSWDLTADDVFGMYFVYDVTNYDMVVEADETLALYHFDGNLYDESAYGGAASYTVGASHNYVDHSSFNAALYWDSSEHQLGLSGISGGSTYEMMLYPTQGNQEPSGLLLKQYSGLAAVSAYPEDMSIVIDMSGGRVLDIEYGFDRTKELYLTYDGEQVYTNVIRYLSGYLLTVDGIGYFPIISNVVLQERYVNPSQPTGVNNKRVYYSILSSDVSICYGDSSGSYIPIGIGSWHYLAVSGGQAYLDGLAVDGLSGGSDISGTALYMPAYGNYTMIDELRISSNVLYDGTYTPQSHPFDTNKVLVLPETGSQGGVAVKSSIPIADVRIGGVRPTYPALGDLYVAITKESDTVHKASQAQQYQTGGWVNVDAVIYDAGQWLTLKDYNMRSYTIEPGDIPDPGGDDSSSSSGDTTPGDGDDEEGFFAWLLRVLGDFFGSIIGGIINLVKMLVEGIITLVTSLFEALWSLLDFVTGFGEFLGAAFGFLPPEIISLIVLGLTLAIVLMIVKFLRG